MAVDAVIFDWGGTLTRWHDVDFHEESLALAQAVVQTADEPVDLAELAPRLHEASDAIWGAVARPAAQRTIADLFTEAGLDHDPELLHAYYDFWEPHTSTDPEVRPLFEDAARARDQGRRAVQHDLATRVAPRLLRARRGARPHRRRRLHLRDPVDQAGAARRSTRPSRRSG